MTPRASVLLLLVLLGGGCAERSGLVRWEDVEPARERTSAAPAAVEASPEKRPPEKPLPAKPLPAKPPPVKPPPVKPPPEQPSPERQPPEKKAAVASPGPLGAGGTLLVNGSRVDDGAVVEVPALELACLADARALTEPTRVAARVAEHGDKLGASLAAFAFVVIERDPAHSITDPPPRFCRRLQGTATLVAPLLHRSEPATRWLVRRAKAGVVADAAALLEDCRAKGLTPSGRPRALLDDEGALTALAMPVGAGGG